MVIASVVLRTRKRKSLSNGSFRIFPKELFTFGCVYRDVLWRKVVLVSRFFYKVSKSYEQGSDISGLYRGGQYNPYY